MFLKPTVYLQIFRKAKMNLLKDTPVQPNTLSEQEFLGRE